jgi:hypothetical protein
LFRSEIWKNPKAINLLSPNVFDLNTMQLMPLVRSNQNILSDADTGTYEGVLEQSGRKVYVPVPQKGRTAHP